MSNFDSASKPGDSLWNADPVGDRRDPPTIMSDPNYPGIPLAGGNSFRPYAPLSGLDPGPGPWGNEAAQDELVGSFTPADAPTSYPGDVAIEPACNSRNPGACPPLDEDTSAFTAIPVWGVEKGGSLLAGKKLAGVPGKLVEAPFEAADDRNHPAEAHERADREAVETFHQNLAADEAERDDDIAARRGEEQDQRLPPVHPTEDNDPYPASEPSKCEEPTIGPRSNGAGPTSYPGDVPAEGACESTHPENCPPADNGWTWP